MDGEGGTSKEPPTPPQGKMNLTICVYILDIVGYSVVGYRPSPGLVNCYTKEILNKHIDTKITVKMCVNKMRNNIHKWQKCPDLGQNVLIF